MATAGPREIISIFFPRDFQMARLYAFPTKPMEKIPPAEPGHAVRVRVFETYLEPHKRRVANMVGRSAG